MLGGEIFSPLNALLLIGLAIFLEILGARIFKKFRIPQVVGYIAVGLLVGESGFKIISGEVVEILRPFTFFALGIIGFLIGGGLRKEVFKKYGKSFFTILLGEGLVLSFWLVSSPQLLVCILPTISFFLLSSGLFWGRFPPPLTLQLR